MNAVSKITPTNIVALVEATPVIVLTDREKFSQFYEEMRRETDALDADVQTKKGREAIKSMAYKVARTKTAIDEAGKKLNEEARARINAVDESRRVIRKQLDDLKDEVRKPLTEWEEAEADREVKATGELNRIRALSHVDFVDTAGTVQERIDELTALVIDNDLHRAGADQAESAKSAAIAVLQDAHARLVREEADRAELAKLRAEAEERDRVEREAAEREEEERQRAEAVKAAAEAKAKAEADAKARAEAIAREAEQRATREAEAKAQAERDAAERAHAEALASERRRAEQAEAAIKAEQSRIAAEQAETARREADRAHRGKVMGEAKAAIITCGCDEQVAKAIVLAIVGKTIPHISIQF